MIKIIKLILVVVILTLNYSCFEDKSHNKEKNDAYLKSISKSDTLNYGSGVREIFQDRKGNYWFGIHNGGISKFDGKSFSYFTVNDGLLDNQIRTIIEDENGNILISTAKGLSVFDGQQFKNFTTQKDKPIFNWNESSGNFWFYASEEDGVNRFDGSKLNYLTFPKSDQNNFDDSYGVTDISTDKEGTVWIATYSALFSFDGKKVNSFGAEYFNLKNNDKLHIRSVLADSKGRIWIGNNGIGVFLKTKDQLTHFSKDQNKLIPLDEFDYNSKTKQFHKNTGIQSVFEIFEDCEGNIWFGDRDSGAWKYDGEKLINYVIDTKLKSQMIWKIYQDQNNNLLFGMAEGGVYKFNGKSFEKQF